jgi:hypothetical protein
MYRKHLLLLGGGIGILVSAFLLISVHVQGISTSPKIPPLAACTPTPAVRAPYPTLSAEEQKTPGIGLTAIAHYQATHPGDVHNPKQVTDLAPQLSKGQKPEVIVRDPDCTYEGFLIAPDQQAYNALATSLPTNHLIISMLPAPDSLRHTAIPGLTGPAGTPGVYINHQGTPITIVPTPSFPVP